MYRRNSIVKIERLSLKKVIHIHHQPYSLKVLVNDGNLYLDCTMADSAHAVRLSIL